MQSPLFFSPCQYHPMCDPNNRLKPSWTDFKRNISFYFNLFHLFCLAGISSSNTSLRWLKNSSPGSRRCRWRHAARQSSPSSLIWWVQPHRNTRLQVWNPHCLLQYRELNSQTKLPEKIHGAAVLNGFVPGTLPFYICPSFCNSFFSFKMWDWNESFCLFPVAFIRMKRWFTAVWTSWRTPR